MRPTLHLETARLLIRSWQITDVENYQTLSKDVGYNCFSPPGFYLAKDERETRQKVQTRMDLYETKGLGKFPVFEKTSGEIVGTAGIEPYAIEGIPEVELGYRLRLAHWEKGYATESAQAILEYGLKTLSLPQIFGFAVRQNRASVQVLRKLGMEEIGILQHAGLPHLLFRTGAG